MQKCLAVVGLVPLLATASANAACPAPDTSVQILSPVNQSTNHVINTSIYMGGPGVQLVQTAQLTTAGGTAILGSLSGVPGLLIFQPGQLLTPNTAYSVHVVDFGNNVLATANFTTGTAEDQTFPSAPGDPVAVVGTAYDFGNPDPNCPTSGGWPVSVTWTAATDDHSLVYAVQAALGNTALTVAYSSTNALLATFTAPPSSHIELLVRAFDGSLHGNVSNTTTLDTAAAPPTPTPSPTATPGNPSDKGGGCSCELGDSAPTLSASFGIAAAALGLSLLRRRRRLS